MATRESIETDYKRAQTTTLEDTYILEEEEGAKKSMIRKAGGETQNAQVEGLLGSSVS